MSFRDRADGWMPSLNWLKYFQVIRDLDWSIRLSAYHCRCQQILQRDEEYIDEATFQSHRQLIEHFWKVLNGYIAYLQKAAKENKNPKA